MSHYRTRKEAAQFLKERYRRGSYSWLTRLAADGTGPRHQRFGSKAVLYAEADLIAWAEQYIRAPEEQAEKPEPAPQPTHSADTPVVDHDHALRAAFRVINALA